MAAGSGPALTPAGSDSTLGAAPGARARRVNLGDAVSRRSPAGVWILTCLLSAALAAAPVGARAEDEVEERPHVMAGVGATVCTLVYSPLKLAYAASGLVVGSMAWLWSFGSRRVTQPIFRSALGGDYVVTPEHLTGKRKLRFAGRRR